LPLIPELYYKEIFNDILSDAKKGFAVMVKKKSLMERDVLNMNWKPAWKR